MNSAASGGTRLKALNEELESIHRRNGELLTEIQSVQKRLELLRSKVNLAEAKANTEPLILPYVISAALVLFGLWFLIRK